jgi:hypothetical protein
MAVTKGQRPSRPCRDRGLDDEMWAFIEKCWKTMPTERPMAANVAAYLRSRSNRIGDQNDAGDWDDAFVSRFRSALAGNPFDYPDYIDASDGVEGGCK